MIKKDLCNHLLQNNLVKPWLVFRHSYTNARRSELDRGGQMNETFIDVCPTLDTRCDCFAVVVIEKGQTDE